MRGKSADSLKPDLVDLVCSKTELAVLAQHFAALLVSGGHIRQENYPGWTGGSLKCFSRGCILLHVYPVELRLT